MQQETATDRRTKSPSEPTTVAASSARRGCWRSATTSRRAASTPSNSSCATAADTTNGTDRTAPRPAEHRAPLAFSRGREQWPETLSAGPAFGNVPREQPGARGDLLRCGYGASRIPASTQEPQFDASARSRARVSAAWFHHHGGARRQGPGREQHSSRRGRAFGGLHGEARARRTCALAVLSVVGHPGNQFAAAPDVGSAIVPSVADELGEITSRLSQATGAEAEAVTREMFETTFRATGPDYWRYSLERASRECPLMPRGHRLA